MDVHIQVDPRPSVEESHAVASRVEREVRDTLGGTTSVVVHVEPADNAAAALPAEGAKIAERDQEERQIR